jgi:hypothetical protein
MKRSPGKIIDCPETELDKGLRVEDAGGEEMRPTSPAWQTRMDSGELGRSLWIRLRAHGRLGREKRPEAFREIKGRDQMDDDQPGLLPVEAKMEGHRH